MRKSFTFLFIILFSQFNHLQGQIVIDGILNEPVWQNSIYSGKFYDDNGSYPNTKAYFTYDSSNLYIAFKCRVKDTALLNKNKTGKDDQQILQNDFVAFSIDTYNDKINAYVFLVDAAGNRLDGAFNRPRDLTYSFSTKWTAAINKEKNAYTVEMKIPMNKLPIRWNNGNAAVAIQFIRNNKQLGRLVQTPNTKNLAYFDTLTLRGIARTHPTNLSGVDLSKRLAYKKSKFNRNTLIGRAQGGDASVMDYLLFKKRTIHGAEKPREFHYKLANKKVVETFENTKYFKSLDTDIAFETFLERSQTTAFLVLHNDTALYENYFNGFNKDSIFTSFSVAKSFVSTLIGMAISDGYIHSIIDKITTYLPQLLKNDKRFSDITIKDLLSMSSGLAYSEKGFPSDDDITYISPDLRSATLKHVKVVELPGKHWLYNNYNPLLLGMILEKTTGKSVSAYMEEKLWKKMGGGYASWSLDEHGFEKMESGINCRSYDYARFALLLLNKGKYKNVQGIPQEWIRKATQPQKRPKGYYDFLLKNNVFYSYFWWGKFRDNKKNEDDFFAIGNKGEYVYISPQKKLIIIRLGFEYGLVPGSLTWPEMFYQFASNFK